MKFLLSLSLFIFLFSMAFAQNKTKAKPFIIKGKIINSENNFITIYYEKANGEEVNHKIDLDNEGNFYYKTDDKIKPQIGHIEYFQLFIGPSYNLYMTANGVDDFTFFKTKKISGSESNRYFSVLDSVILSKNQSVNPFKLPEKEALAFFNNENFEKDSIAKAVLNKPSKNDKYLKYFYKQVLLENELNCMSKIIDYAAFNVYDNSKSENLLNNNIDKSVLENFFKGKYLNTFEFRSWLSNKYLSFLINIDLKKDPKLEGKKNYRFEKIVKLSQGQTREFLLFKNIQSKIGNFNTNEELNEYIKIVDPYLSSISNPIHKKIITNALERTKLNLVSLQTGNPAPLFTLKSNDEKTFSLADFKGKVVYLDLWASWCGPCREETPAFKKLYEKYRNDARIAFISIAVHDGMKKWKKALEEDQPTWLQLLDDKAQVSNLYNAHYIPKFVIIDKKGNLVNFDAPRPSSGKELEDQLNTEMVK